MSKIFIYTVFVFFSIFIGVSCYAQTEEKYDTIMAYNENLAAVQMNGKWGYVDEALNLVIPCKYDAVASFHNGYARVLWKEKLGYINKKGKGITSFKYDSGNDFRNGFALVKIGAQIGMINTEGKEIIPLEYTYIKFLPVPSSNGFADFLDNEKNDSEYIKVTKNHLSGVAHKSTGKTIIPLKFSDIKMYSDKLFLVSRKDSNGWSSKYGLFNVVGKEILPPVYDEIKTEKSLPEEISIVKLKNEYGLINSNGELITPVKYSETPKPMKNGLFLVRVRYRQGVIDETGKEVIPVIYDKINMNIKEDDELIAVKTNGKWGYVNKKGKLVIDFLYDEAFPFREGMAGVQLKDSEDGVYNGWGFIDESGKLLIKTKYSSISDFCEGLAGVCHGKCGFIDKEGKEIIPLNYENATSFSEGLAGVMIDNKWGFIDRTGKLVIPNKYIVLMSHFEEGVAKVKSLDGSIVFIDKEGEEYKSKEKALK